jgi:hypothetical protein
MYRNRLGWIAASVISFGLGLAVSGANVQSSISDTSHYGSIQTENCGSTAGCSGKAKCGQKSVKSGCAQASNSGAGCNH